MRHLMNISDLTTGETERLISLSSSMMEHPDDFRDLCRHKKLATLFFEPSTRTRLSFEAAMLELGGNTLGFSAASASSAAKGESIADTARAVGYYADIIVMRHPLEGAPYVASLHSGVPVINAGDGGHNHPTQTLTDLLTIDRVKKSLGGLTVGLCGDLKYGRTVHSLITAMSRYPGNRFVLISPSELKVPSYVKNDILKKNNIEYFETANLEQVIPSLDILYMTRIQQERFPSQDEYMRLKDNYILTPEKIKPAKPDLCIMHPLPRVNEISVAIDRDPRAYYFEQVRNGKYIRMALIASLLGLAPGILDREETKPDDKKEIRRDLICSNPRCITVSEQELTQGFYLSDSELGTYRCIYCESKYKPVM